jgi:glyoxylase-like metal-dependent hydrolase (beta-lactamase superfamily II)
MYDPAADRGETFEAPVSCVLLRHPQGNVLFDTGCHPSVAENPEARWGKLVRVMTPVMPQGEHVVNGLKAIGVATGDIDVVICSHLHPDHCGCNAFLSARLSSSTKRRSQRRARPRPRCPAIFRKNGTFQ